ncbi:hypothetical protein DFH11DRAFT_1877828 [Phellopilus nigrolimitatus]|nr:hypothetical protein DFH11DRAFT_1877828 [Phellopilus nigrolimitatus]
MAEEDAVLSRGEDNQDMRAIIEKRGMAVSAYFQAIGTARRFHRREERELAYRSFDYAAALLEILPITALFFSISNCMGGVSWAHVGAYERLFLVAFVNGGEFKRDTFPAFVFAVAAAAAEA